jgi:hypothetical protein
MRPNQILNKTPSLWGRTGILPHEAGLPGKLNDRWFLAAATALAEIPHRV